MLYWSAQGATSWNPPQPSPPTPARFSHPRGPLRAQGCQGNSPQSYSYIFYRPPSPCFIPLIVSFFLRESTLPSPNQPPFPTPKSLSLSSYFSLCLLSFSFHPLLANFARETRECVAPLPIKAPIFSLLLRLFLLHPFVLSLYFSTSTFPGIHLHIFPNVYTLFLAFASLLFSLRNICRHQETVRLYKPVFVASGTMHFWLPTKKNLRWFRARRDHSLAHFFIHVFWLN